ncbi:MAG TPA: ankyrin repeat domain-containing protein [Burkholderiaceae bacterium]|nr:ankyrin repeat domain-containing protein [Burkholderiaceae bacterium]
MTYSLRRVHSEPGLLSQPTDYALTTRTQVNPLNVAREFKQLGLFIDPRFRIDLVPRSQQERHVQAFIDFTRDALRRGGLYDAINRLVMFGQHRDAFLGLAALCSARVLPWTPYWPTAGDGDTLVHALAQVGCDVAPQGFNDDVSAQKPFTLKERFETLRDAGLSLDEPDADHCVPFIVAAQTNNIAAQEALIAAGANVRTGERVTPLTWAAENGKADTVRLLIKAGVEIEPTNENSGSVLHIAARHGHVDVARVLLDQPINIDAKGRSGLTALHMATRKGHTQTVRLLLEKGADVNALDSFGISALHFAATYGRADIAALLLANNAKKDVADEERLTALLRATLAGHADVVRVLLDAKVEANATNRWGVTALHMAVEEGHTEIVELLLNSSINKNATAHLNRTALHIAALEGRADLVRLLVQGGVDKNLADSQGHTASNLATQNGHIDVVHALEN